MNLVLTAMCASPSVGELPLESTFVGTCVWGTEHDATQPRTCPKAVGPGGEAGGAGGARVVVQGYPAHYLPIPPIEFINANQNIYTNIICAKDDE